MTDSANYIAPPPRNGTAPTAPFLSRTRALRLFAIGTILWLALFLRVWRLDVLPPGLHYDEAFKGVEARAILKGEKLPIFFVENFGEEPLQIYTTALMFRIVGESPWSIRLVSAFFGVIFVAALYACSRALFPGSDWTALAAAFIAATLYWAVNFSRIGLETNGLPMLLTLSAAALARAYRKMTWAWILGAGILTGAAVYTYLASRVWLGAVLLWFVYLLLTHRADLRAHLDRWLIFGLVVLLTLLPLILFFVANPIALSGRSGTVFTPETFFTNLLRTAGMFFVSGDTDPRDNLPGRPALDVLLAILFLVGLVISFARLRKPFHAFLLIWFMVMCLPSALTEFAPNFRRAIGAMPATLLLCAVGIETLSKLAISRHFPFLHQSPNSCLQAVSFSAPISNLQSPSSRLTPVLLLAALALSAAWSARAYFIDWASGAGLYYSFDAGLLQVGRALAARPANEQLFLTPNYNDHYTVLWALNGRHISSFDGRQGLVLPDSSRAATYGIITYEDQTTSEALGRAFTHPEPQQHFLDAQGQDYAALVTFPIGASRVAPAPQFQPIRVADWAFLTGAQVSPPIPERDKTLRVFLEWRAVHAAERDYTVSVQLLGPLNPATQSPLWAQQDKQPIAGTYPTTRWQPGEMISESYTLRVPPDAPPGKYQIRVGLYDLPTGRRVPLTYSSSAPVADDAVPVLDFDLR